MNGNSLNVVNLSLTKLYYKDNDWGSLSDVLCLSLSINGYTIRAHLTSDGDNRYQHLDIMLQAMNRQRYFNLVMLIYLNTLFMLYTSDLMNYLGLTF